jgi:hypothetical protein
MDVAVPEIGVFLPSMGKPGLLAGPAEGSGVPGDVRRRGTAA